MSLSTIINKKQYYGNGSTTNFPMTFPFNANSEIVVTETNISTGVSTTLSLTTHYTLTGAGTGSNGTVTAVTAPSSSVYWTILRVVPITQTVNYVRNDPFPSDTHEAVVDKLTEICQQLQEQLDRCLYIPATDLTESTALADSVTRAGKQLGFDENGDLTYIESADSSAESAAASAASAEASATAAAASAASVTYEGVRGYRTQTLTGTITLVAGTDYVNQDFTGTVSSGTVIAGGTTGSPQAGHTFFVYLVGVVVSSGGSIVIKSGSTTLITYSGLGTYSGCIKMIYTGSAWVARVLDMQIV